MPHGARTVLLERARGVLGVLKRHEWRDAGQA
jgi:hypothetical protein